MAIVLVAVSALMAISYVLGAVTQNLGTVLTVTYEATNVNATVYVSSKTQSENDNTYSNVSHKFYVTASTNSASLTASSETIGGFVSTTFQRYAVYRFTFTNDNSTGGRALNVSGSYTQGASSNTVLLWVASNSATTPAVTAPSADSVNAWPSQSLSSGSTTVSVTSNGTSFTVANNIPAQGSYYLYLYVAIADVSLPSSFSIGGASSNSLSFTLTSAS